MDDGRQQTGLYDFPQIKVLSLIKIEKATMHVKTMCF